MEDYDHIDSMMDGKPFKAGRHAATLRRMVWREHLGLLPAQVVDASDDPNAQPPDVPNNSYEGPEYEFVADPLSDKVWDMWTTNATNNTEMFRHLFRADPDDHSKYSIYKTRPPSLLRLIVMIQSKRSTTTRISYLKTISSKAICRTHLCL